MALLPKLHMKSFDPDKTIIPSIYADPGYAAAEALLTAFRYHLIRIEEEQLRLHYEHALAGRNPSEDNHTQAAQREQLKTLQVLPALQGRTSTPPDAPAAPAAPATAISRGEAILKGEKMPPTLDLATRLRALARDADALGIAIRDQTDVVDQIRQELSFQYATRLQPAWDASNLEMFRAAQAFSRAARRHQEFRAAITDAGIGSVSQILRTPNVRSPLVLGQEDNYDNEISGWRRILESWGVL